MQARLPLLEFPEELMQQSVNTNVWGTVRMMKAVLPHMIERNYGRIVHPAEVAAAVAFLGSFEASYITGQLLGVNGRHPHALGRAPIWYYPSLVTGYFA